MSTKKENKTVCICVEVEKLESLKQRIEVLQILEDIMVTAKSTMKYFEQDAKAYAENGLDNYAQKEAERAENYAYAIAIIGKLAEKI